MFNAQEHLIDIRGRDYLEVKWRLVWLREEHPGWTISTELLDAGDPVIVRAAIADEAGHVIATGHAEYPRGKPFPSVMKCETSAIGRALAHAGFGTQFAGEDVEEVEVVDAPVARPAVDEAQAEALMGEIGGAASREALRRMRERVLAVPPGTPVGEALRDAYKRAWEDLDDRVPNGRAA